MKRKLLATFTALITVFCCALGLSACGGNEPELTAVQKAYKNYFTTQNMTVRVTDTRTEKHGYDYTALVELDYAHKTAHTKRNGFEDYCEITETNGNLGCTAYGAAYMEYDGNLSIEWSKVVRDDFFNNEQQAQFNNSDDYAIYKLSDWVSSDLPTHMLPDASFSIGENDELHYASLELLNDLFTESENGYSASICFCVNDGNGYFIPYACTATIKLDGQGRFESVVLDLGENGEISAVFTYGTANVVIPDNVKNC